MHSHQVFFYLNPGQSKSALLEFEKGLENLIKIPLVLSGYYGKPANTSRTVVDHSYSYGLTLIFKDTVDHNLYQSDPIHLAFIDHNAAKWARVMVFDVETTSSSMNK